jgi:hypothetical protein
MSVVTNYELDMCYESVFELATYNTCCNNNDTFGKYAHYGMGVLIHLQVTKLKLIY